MDRKVEMVQFGGDDVGVVIAPDHPALLVELHVVRQRSGAARELGGPARTVMEENLVFALVLVVLDQIAHLSLVVQEREGRVGVIPGGIVVRMEISAVRLPPW